jgi:hypothetical protein
MIKRQTKNNKEKNNGAEKNINKNIKKIIRISVIVLTTAVVLSGLLWAAVWYFSAVRLDYYIKTEFGGTVRITASLNQTPGFAPDTAEFSVCAYEMSDISCVDEKGTRVEYEIKDGTITLDNIKDNRTVNFSYSVYCPPIASITAFSWDDILALPPDITARRVTFAGETFDGAMMVFPYDEIRNPAWIDWHNISTSCFVFGSFRQSKLESGVTLYIDRSIDESSDKGISEVVDPVNLYYQSVFGKKPDFSLIIAGRDDEGLSVGIVGGKTIALPLDTDNANDCKTLCHSLFYPYFDTYVAAGSFRFPPNLWLNRGLATYYENLALDTLPQTVRDTLELGSAGGLSELYTRYLYYHIKEPAAYKITPAEESILSMAAAQFYYYTKAPLVVAAIENLSGNRNMLLKSLMENENFSVSNAVYHTVGESATDILGYLNDEKIIPAPLERETEDHVETMQVIMNYEYILNSWYRLSSPEYPLEEIDALNPMAVLNMTTSLEIAFADEETESAVWDYSRVVFVLLRQNALRTFACGESLEDPALRFALASEENTVRWQQYIRKNDLAEFDNAGQ